MRLAWFTPWPPQPSGVAGRSADVVPALAARGHGIDVCVDERAVAAPGDRSNEAPAPGAVRLQSAHDFIWRQARGQYDLTVYQLGNSRTHEFIWPYARRFPGLAVLHEARLHHARGRALLLRGETAAYRTLFRWNEPGVHADAAELAVAGFDGPYYYLWPMVRDIVTTSRAVAVHARGAVDLLRETWPDRPIEYVPLGEGRSTAATPAERETARAGLQLAPSAIVFGVFGALTPDKRIAEILRAFAGLRARIPDAQLLLGGAADPSHDWRGLADTLGVSDLRVLPGLDDRAFDAAILAADATLHLRWPSAIETSGPWLRALAAGRATVTTNLAHQTHVPALDPRTWTLYAGTGPPVTVAVDILDEDHSLGLALRRLAMDRELRETLGRSARRYWEREHTLERMVDGYEDGLARTAALSTAPNGTAQPGLADPLRQVRAILDDFPGVSCELR
jgi:glycosyltransferase involved in cell wall biosynthesis